MLGLVSPFPSAPLAFGGIVHVGLACLFRGQTLEEAHTTMQEQWEGDPVDDVRTLANAQRLVRVWREERGAAYPSAFMVEGTPFVEQAFCFPTGRTLLDGEEIEYGGIIDAGVFVSGIKHPLDHKTTSQLGDSYYDQFTPSAQMTGYLWGMRKWFPEEKVQGPIINAMCLTRGGKIVTNPPHLLSRTQYQLDTWLEGVAATCQKIRDCEISGKWERHENACTTKYGSCPFRSLHILPDKEAEDAVRESRYVEKRWEFLKQERV